MRGREGKNLPEKSAANLEEEREKGTTKKGALCWGWRHTDIPETFDQRRGTAW